jgi:hypothetical protein
MRIHIASGGQGGREVGTWEARILKELASRSGSAEYPLVERPEDADAVLVTDVFFDHRFWRVLLGRTVLGRLDRCYLYCEKGLVSRVLPGLFTSLPRRPWDLGRVRGAWYTCHERGPYRNPYTEGASNAADGATPSGASPSGAGTGFRPRDPDLLYSYIGRTSHPVRAHLVRALPARADALVEESDEYDHWNERSPNRDASQRRYAETIARSHFVLCPRGWSPSSLRVYEVMRMGRAPVVISDAWRPPLGPKWEDFAVFVPEARVAEIPRILADRVAEAPEMGRRARRSWEEHFSPEAEWRTLAASLEDLHRKKRVSEWLFVPLWPAFLASIAVRYLGYRAGGWLRGR